jgi:MFS superfamily sulfate permease-like transporter
MAEEYNKTLVLRNLTFNDSSQALKEYKTKVACSLALFIGVAQALMAFTGLGVLTTYFSDSFISSYMCGSAVHGLMSQIKSFFGLKGLVRYNGALKIPKTLIDIAKKLPSANVATVITSIVCFFYLIVFKEFLNRRIRRITKIEFPSELVLVSTGNFHLLFPTASIQQAILCKVIFATVISYELNLNKEYGVDIVGNIPKGCEAVNT